MGKKGKRDKNKSKPKGSGTGNSNQLPAVASNEPRDTSQAHGTQAADATSNASAIEQSTVSDLLKPTDNPVEPEKDSSSTKAETNGAPETSPFHGREAMKITKQDIISYFQTEQKWRETHTSAISHSAYHRYMLTIRLLQHCAIKNGRIKHVLRYGELLMQNAWPFTEFPAQLKVNQFEWLQWITFLDEAIPHVIKHINYMVLLEQEYKSVEPMWDHFWKLVRLGREGRELEELEEKVATFNRRRVFLQISMMAEKKWVEQLHQPPPEWYDWEDLVRSLQGNVDQVEVRDELASQEVVGGYESGHISELSGTEDDESYEL